MANAQDANNNISSTEKEIVKLRELVSEQAKDIQQKVAKISLLEKENTEHLENIKSLTAQAIKQDRDSKRLSSELTRRLHDEAAVLNAACKFHYREKSAKAAAENELNELKDELNVLKDELNELKDELN